MIWALLGGVPTSPQQHEFVYVANAPLRSVSVAGTFNQWNKEANPLALSFDGKTWRAVVKIAPGRHQYRFVLEGTRWVSDPRAPRAEDDGHGNVNSVLVVLPPEYATPARKGDGKITATALRHTRRSPDVNLDRGHLSLSLLARPGDVERIDVLIGGRRRPMALLSEDEVAARYQAQVPWDGKSALRYSFDLTDGPRSWRFGSRGLTKRSTVNSFLLDPKEFRPIVVPNWVERTVFYQIFPDRFDNGDRSNDHPATAGWDEGPTWFNRFGGDAAGVLRRIGYLGHLGVNGVYLNPVMRAPSNHRYDPVDFYRVDPEIGTNEEFAALTKALQRAGVRVVLDQIFDHVGTTFPPFVDLLKNQQQSRYRDWFFVKRWPVEVKRDPPYEAWYGAESMPKVNLAHPGVKAYLLESVDYWHRNASLSGWRLDVANEVPAWFWREFRIRVKAIDPNAWIVGEVWSEASEWLQGDQWDASMNYPWRDAVLRFIARGETKPSQFLRSLMSVYGLYAPQVSRNQLNLLSSHDTPRFLTEAKGDRSLQRLAAVVQFAWPGAPSVYYGEEVGMEGRRDPDNRRPMRWDLVGADNEMLAHYRRLIALRTGSRVLQQGDPVALPCFDSQQVACFARRLGSETSWVALNRSTRTQTINLALGSDAPKRFIDALSARRLVANRKGVVRLTIAPKSAVLALQATESNLTLLDRVQRDRAKTYLHPTTTTQKTNTPRRTHG